MKNKSLFNDMDKLVNDFYKDISSIIKKLKDTEKRKENFIPRTNNKNERPLK